MDEVIPPYEAEDIAALVELSEQLLETSRCPVRRGQHPKHHGCVYAEFIVQPGLSRELARGVFATPRTIPAWVRFSNGSQDDDRIPDIHGMAIKLVGVDGEKLLEEERQALTQDFVLMDNATFFAKDVRANRGLAAAMLRSRQPSFLKSVLFWMPEMQRRTMSVLINHFILGLRFRELWVLRAATSKKPDNPLDITYWSATPYSLGELVVKYKAVPMAAGNTAPVADSPDRLRAAMKARLLAAEVRFDFLVQRFANNRRTPIEDASVEWNEKVAPFVKVAEVVIPLQEFDTPDQMTFCEHLSYTPWHTLPDHRPLGGVNRARQDVYRKLSAMRHEYNCAPLREPVPGDPPRPRQVSPLERSGATTPAMTEKPRSKRATDADGRGNRIERYILTHFGLFWRLAQRVPALERRLNGLLINRAVAKCPCRPNPHSMRGDYPSWHSLTDRTYTGRHLPPADDAFMQALPPIEQVLSLFERPNGTIRLSTKSTVLFSHFAQWFTDGFLRTARKTTGGGPDYQKNTSNHEIDLSPLYGRTLAVATALRANDGTGKLRSQFIRPDMRAEGTLRVGGEFPPYYFTNEFVYKQTKVHTVRSEFSKIADELHLLHAEEEFLRDPTLRDRIRSRFAMGVERANNQIGYVMLNVLFLREHNRLCDLLKKHHPTWDDDRLYHTARNTVIVMVIKLVVEEYINHISPFHFQFRAQPEAFYASRWYRTNWITLEFNLLYRWHGLVPNHMKVGNRCYPLDQTIFNNDLLIDVGLAAAIDSASRQPAGSVMLRNTPPYLVERVERPSLQIARDARLRRYNDYREYAGYPRATRFDQITSDPWLQRELQHIYKTPDGMELFVGLFAEDTEAGSALPPLIGRMVAIDAFSQALTNPLMSERVYRPETFAEGWGELVKTRSLGDVVARNVPNEPITTPVVTMTQR